MRGWKVWVEPSGDGRYRCRWRGRYGTGQQTFVYKSDARDAEDGKRRNFQRQDGGLAPLPIATGEDLKRFLSRYAKERATTRAAQTLKIDARAAGLFLDFFGDRPMSTITPAVIEAFKHHLMEMKWSRAKAKRDYHPNTVRIYLRALKTCLRWAFKRHVIPADPFHGVEFPPEVAVARPPSDDAVLKLWPHLSDVARRAMTVIAYTGMRLGELLSLTAQSVKPPAAAGDAWILTVRKSKTRRGREEFKTFALPAPALAAIQPIPPTGPLFNVSRRLLQSSIEDARTKAGLGRVRWHDFRHRWATEFMQAVKDEYALMQVGGWASRAAVARYQHPTDERRDSTLKIRLNLPPIGPYKGGDIDGS